MFKFPREPDPRRALWVKNVDRADWIPTPYSMLCEAHFSLDSFVTTPDGKRKLSPNAIPTIFKNRVIQNESQEDAFCEAEQSDTHGSVPVTAKDSIEEDLGHVGNRKSSSLKRTFELPVNNSDPSQPKKARLSEIDSVFPDAETPVQNKECINCQLNNDKMKELEKKLNAANQQIRRLVNKFEEQVRSNKLAECLSKMLHPDQIAFLAKGYKKMPKWCAETLLDAYKLRFACGSSGYEELREMNYPLPCIRTLTKKMESLKFKPGEIIEEVLEFMKVKVNSFQELQKDCFVIMDEMSHTPGEHFDLSTNNFLGRVTLPDHDQKVIATHACVIMLVGLGARWKQIVQFDFTGDSVNGRVFKPIIFEIIRRYENEVGLRIHGVTTDMGPNNQALWQACGINASKYSTIKNFCIHPCDSNRKLYFYADAPHAFKNTKTGLLNSTNIIIPDDFLIYYNLSSKIIDKNYLHELFNEDKDNELKLAPKLTEACLNTKNHFAKMRVGNAKNVLSEDVSCGIQFVQEMRDVTSGERLTTAWFVGFMSKWFEYMCSRNMNFALSYQNEEKYYETINFLENAILLFTEIQFGRGWKPYQTALILATRTVIDLSKYLLDGHFTFFLPCRLTQDCLENLFSIVRMKNVVPHAVQFKNDLKLICISQYMKLVSNSNYDQDDRQFLTEFLEILKYQNKSKPIDHNASQICISELDINIGIKELNALYYIAGYIISSIKENQKSCDSCISATVTQKQDLVPNSQNILARIKAKNNKNLLFVNESTFEFFLRMETIFRSYIDTLPKINFNLKNFFVKKYQDIPFDIPECHGLKQKIISRFYSFRVKNKKIRKNKVDNKSYIFASESVAMHESVK